MTVSHGYRLVKKVPNMYSRKRIMAALKNAKASVQIEGYVFSSEEDQVLVDKSLGRISHTEFLKKVKELALNVR